MINLKVRFKNPQFYITLLIAVGAPIMSYFGLTGADFTSWPMVINTFVKAISNPYVVVLVATSVYNAMIDPTTKGIRDSERALTYTKPFEDRR